MEYSSSLTVGGERVRLPSELPPGTRAQYKANSIFVPLGPLHSTAYLLLSGKSVRTLADSENTARTIVWGQTGDGATSLSSPGWYLSKAERLLQGGPVDDAAIFLCEFVDARYLLDRTYSNENITANIRSYANSADYLTGTSGYTWTSLVEELWEACDLLGAFPGLPSDLNSVLDGVPQNTFFTGTNAWRSLCTVLDLLDCAVMPIPTTGAFGITRLGGTQTLPDRKNSLQWDGEPIRNLLDVAETLRVMYYYHRKSYGQERDTSLTDNWVKDGQGNSQTVATGVGGVKGTKVLWDDLPWLLDENDTHTNLSAINDRTANRKARYVTRSIVSPAHKIYSGIHTDYLPGKRVRAVIWRDWGDLESALGGTVTEYVSGPELIAQHPTADGSGMLQWFGKESKAVEQENYLGPDVGRHSYPNYPRLPNIVQVYHSAGTQGTIVSPNSSKLHPGSVRRYVSGALAVLEDCWIRFVDEHDTNLGNVDVTDGDCFFARLSGMETHDGIPLPLYIARAGNAGDALVRFKLTANLALAGSANANPCKIDGTDWVADTSKTIVVMDPYDDPGCWIGKIGYEGFCVKRPGDKDTGIWDQKYDIVWMERPALIVDWTALTDRVGADPHIVVKVEGYNQQGDKAPPGIVTSGSGDELEIHDPDFLFPKILAGCKGKAIYNDREDKYYIFTAQQRATFIAANADGAQCGGSQMAIMGAGTLLFSQYSVLPAGGVPSLINDLNMAVMDGDVVYGVWDNFQEEYVVLNVQHHEQYVLTAWRFNVATGCYQYKRRKAFISTCEEESDWIDDECGSVCGAGGG